MSKIAIIEKALSDSTFRQKLLENPTAICRSEGADLPVGVNVRVVETHPTDIHFFIGVKTASPEVNAVLERAEQDNTFCKELCDDPQRVLSELAGLQIKPGSTVTVHSASEGKYVLLLPAEEHETSELNDDELAAVSGGGLLKNLINRLCGDTTYVVIDQGGRYNGYVDESIGTGTGSAGSVMVW